SSPDVRLAALPGGIVLTGGIDGVADVSLGAEAVSVAGFEIGWFVQGSRSTGFFSSGLGMGGGSGVAEGGCTAEGASGMASFLAGCVCVGWDCVFEPEEDCAAHADTKLN